MSKGSFKQITRKVKVDKCHTRGGSVNYFCQTTNNVIFEEHESISSSKFKGLSQSTYLIVLLVDFDW